MISVNVKGSHNLGQKEEYRVFLDWEKLNFHVKGNDVELLKMKCTWKEDFREEWTSGK